MGIYLKKLRLKAEPVGYKDNKTGICMVTSVNIAQLRLVHQVMQSSLRNRYSKCSYYNGKIKRKLNVFHSFGFWLT